MDGLMPCSTRLQGRRRYDYMEVIGRVDSGTETENESGDRVEGSTRTAHAHGWAVCSECMDAQDAYKEVGG